MMKPALFVLTAFALSACVGSNVQQTPQDVTFAKNETLTSCPGLTGVSAQYSRSVAGMPFRCGPQTQNPVTYQ